MADLLVPVLLLALLLAFCLPPALGTARTLLGADPGRRLPLLRDRWQVLEQSATGVFALAVAGVVLPWHQLPVALWGLGATATALCLVGGALAAPSLPALAGDRHGRLRPRTRVLSALVSVVLAALALLARL